MSTSEMKKNLEVHIATLQAQVKNIKSIETEDYETVKKLEEQKQDTLNTITQLENSKCSCVELEQLAQYTEDIESKQKELKAIETLINNNQQMTKNKIHVALDELFNAAQKAKSDFKTLDSTLIPQTAFNKLQKELEYMENQHNSINSISSFISSTIHKYMFYFPENKNRTQFNYNFYEQTNGSKEHLGASFYPTKLINLVKALQQYERAESISLL